jgi:uncharacterized protein YukE
MGDPLSDPRAARLLSADPGEVASLAGAFHRVASQAQTAIAGLHGAHNDATWTGGAADAFRAQLGKLPGDLQKVQQSYGETADALDSYGSQLGPLKSQFRSLAGQISSTQSSLTTAQGDLSAAQSNLSTATSAPHARPTSPAVVNAHTAVQSATGAVGRLQGDLSGLQGQAYRVLDEFDTIRGHARARVSGAAGAAPGHSWWDGTAHAIGNFMSSAGHFFAGTGNFIAKMATGVYDAATSLPSDVVAVYERPGDLHAWSKLGSDAATVAGAVAVVAAVIVCPLDAVGFEAAAAALASTESIATAVGTGSAVLKTGVDTGLAAEGKGSWGTVALDGVSLAAGEVKIPGLRSAEADTASLEGQNGALEAYVAGRESGQTASRAYSALSADQKSALQAATTSLSGNHGLSYLQTSVSSALASAKTLERGLAAKDEVVHFVFDRTKEVGVETATGGARSGG